MQKIIFFVFVLCIPFFLMACGKDSGTNSETSVNSVLEVETSFELGKCSDELEGSSIRVTQENAYYVCVNKKWTFVGTTTIESSANISVSETGSQSSSSSAFVAYTISSNTNSNSSSNYNTTGFFTDSRDMQTYKTVTIGNQTWMAMNLNFETDNSFCHDDYYKDCTVYGRVYTWAAAMDSVGIWSTNGKGCGSGSTCSPTYPVQGVCPNGWHIPTKVEFQILINFVGGSSIGGKNLKSSRGWNDNYSGQESYLQGNGIDKYGFSAKPSFYRYETGYVSAVANYANFWSSTEEKSDSVYVMALTSQYSNVFLGNSGKKMGYGVRCIQNTTSSSSSSSNIIASSSSENLLVDSRDNHRYKTVTIGTQTWMAANLSYETDNSLCVSGTGCMYTWGTAMDSAGIWSTNGKGCGEVSICSPTYPVRGICPNGWHLPTKNEFEKLFTTVGGSNVAGTKLKSRYCWNNSGNGTDDYGFSATPDDGCYGNWADFWSSTEERAWNVYTMILWYSRDWADLGVVGNDQGYYSSVRCIKD